MVGMIPLVAILTGFCEQSPREKQKTARILTEHVAMGTGTLNFSNARMELGARLSSGKFFHGLEIKHTPNGAEYHKGQIAVTQYPHQLHVDIVVFPYESSSGRLLEEDEVLPLIHKITIKAQWKSGLQVTDTKIVSLTIRKPSNQEWSDDVPAWLLADPEFQSQTRDAWDLDLLIENTAVPITDSLVITACVEDCKYLARFSSRL